MSPKKSLTKAVCLDVAFFLLSLSERKGGKRTRMDAEEEPLLNAEPVLTLPHFPGGLSNKKEENK